MFIAFLVLYFIIGLVFTEACVLVSTVLDHDNFDTIKAYCRQRKFWKDIAVNIVLWPVGIISLLRSV